MSSNTSSAGPPQPPTTRPGPLAHAWALFDGLSYPLKIVLYVCFLPLLELLFFFRVRRFLRVRSTQRPAHHAADTVEVERFWSRVLSEEDARTVDAILRGWFLGDGPICEGNLEELVAWTLYATTPQALAGARRTKAARVLQLLIERASRVAPYPPGHNPRRVCMLHTLEPLEPCWKPLLFYLAVQAARARHVVYNFLYATPAPLRHGPRQALHVGYWFRLALHYVLKREPTIQSAFRREFWWGRHWLHPADLPSRAHVALSGRDAIVPSHRVHEYLRRHGATDAPAAVDASAAADASAADAAATDASASPTRLTVELHETRHHGWSVLEPFARRRLVAQLLLLEAQLPPPSSAAATAEERVSPVLHGKAGGGRRAVRASTETNATDDDGGTVIEEEGATDGGSIYSDDAGSSAGEW